MNTLSRFSNDKIQQAFLVIFTLYTTIGMHYWQYSPSGTTLELPAFTMGWIFISLIIGLGTTQIIKSRTFTVTPFIKYSWIAMLFFFIPLLYPIEHNTKNSVFIYLGLIGGWALLAALSQLKLTDHQKTILLGLILIAATIETIIGLCEFYLGFRHQGVIGERPGGMFNHSNLIASFAATGWVIACILLRKIKPAPPKVNPLITIALLTAIFLSTLLITIDQSRTGYLALVISATLLLAVKSAWKAPATKWILITSVSAIFIGALPLSTNNGDSRESREIFKDSGRLPIYRNAISMIIEKPVSGYGIGNFKREFLYSYADSVQQGNIAPNRTIEMSLHPHNEILFWLIEGGIAPLLGMIIFGILTLKSLLRIKPTKAIALCALLTPITLHSQTELPFILSSAHWFVFIFSLWLITDQSSQSRQLKPDHANLFRPLSFCCFFLVPLFLITALHTTYYVMRYTHRPTTTTIDLANIVNPYGWNEKIDFFWHGTHAKIAKATNQPELAKPYIKWAEHQIKIRPEYDYYYHLALAYETTNEQRKLHDTLEVASTLFPSHPEFKDWQTNAMPHQPLSDQP